MTRRPAQRRPRRLPRARTSDHRHAHALDLALLDVRETPATPPDQRALQALAEENALLARELGRVQARCTQWRDECITQAERLEGQLMRTRGELIARQTQVAALAEALNELEQRAAAWRSQETLSLIHI